MCGQEVLSSFFVVVCLFLALLGLHCCAQAFSGCGEPGLLPSCNAQASHCGGFLCQGARAPGALAQQLWCAGLAAVWHAESSQTRDAPLLFVFSHVFFLRFCWWWHREAEII